MAAINREGYIFVGWYVDKALTKRLNPGGKLPGTVRLYPKWKPISYPVYYDLEEGVNSEHNPHEVSVETRIFKLYPARSKGRQFVGWFRNGKRVDYLEEGIQEPVRLKGVFQDPVVVSFDTGGGARIREAVVNACGCLDTLPVPLRIGYEFQNWYLEPARIHRCTSETRFLKPSTLYASWKLKQYEIHYDLQGGFFESSPVQGFTCATPTFILPRPIRPGYDFDGWEDERGNSHLMVRKGSINSRRYIARWSPQTQNVYRISG